MSTPVNIEDITSDANDVEIGGHNEQQCFDKYCRDGVLSSDHFIVEMTKKMKEKFDKYWGECNLLMAFGAVMNPRMKFVVIEYAYPLIYNEEESSRNVAYVRSLLYELYDEYVLSSEVECEDRSGTSRGPTSSSMRTTTTQLGGSKKYSGWHDFTAYVHEKANIRPAKSDLDKYLEDGLEICSPGERVVDTYRSKLGVETVQALICGSNWIRCLYGLKGRTKEIDEDEEMEISLPIS